MDLSFNEEQVMLRDMVNRLCQELAPLTVLRQLEGTEPGFSAQFWQQLGALGLTGLAIPETYGGLQLGALESVVVAEEFGRSLAVSPFHSSAVLAPSLIVTAGNDAQKRDYLTRLARGETIIAIACDEYGGGCGRTGIRTRASRRDGHYLLHGTKHYVAFAASAESLIVLARLDRDADSVVALCVDTAWLAPGDLTYLSNHAKEPLYKVRFDNLQVPLSCALNEGQCIWQHWERAMSLGLIHTAAYAAGAAEQVQSITVDYAKYRHAFGRPIGGFQAIAHYLAEVEVLIAGARTLTCQAAWARDNDEPFEQLAAMAKLKACDVFCRAAAVAIQVHGGIGYTLEADPQLYFRRAKQLQQMYWGPDFLEQKIAEAIFSYPRHDPNDSRFDHPGIAAVGR